MDRVIAYNIVSAHIPAKSNAAADFLSKMQADPKESLELHLVDSIPMKQIEKDMNTKKEQLFPVDMMQIDLVGPFQSPSYKYIISDRDVFSLFLYWRYH